MQEVAVLNEKNPLMCGRRGGRRWFKRRKRASRGRRMSVVTLESSVEAEMKESVRMRTEESVVRGDSGAEM